MALHAAALDHMREGLTEFLQEQVLEDFGMLDPKRFGFTENQWQARLARLVDRAHHRAQRCGTPEALVSLALQDLKGELLQAFSRPSYICMLKTQILLIIFLGLQSQPQCGLSMKPQMPHPHGLNKCVERMVSSNLLFTRSFL